MAITSRDELTHLVLRICTRLKTAWLTEHAASIRLEYDAERGLYNLESLARSLGIPQEAIARMHLRWVTAEHLKLFLVSLLEQLENKKPTT
ncbi:MAG: hypothetical protein FJZ90_04795 [Chloroflexi bacterium]|nr:hypothetical protein [Chloroflexota bacterium]